MNEPTNEEIITLLKDGKFIVFNSAFWRNEGKYRIISFNSENTIAYIAKGTRGKKIYKLEIHRILGDIRCWLRGDNQHIAIEK